MDSGLNLTARRSEDIALDLLKFVAGHSNIGRATPTSTGFGPPTAARPEDQVSQLLELYARCREAVESPVGAVSSTPAAKK